MELMTYTKAQINNNISKLLEEGKSNDDALHFFLKMKMVNDLGPERPFITKAPSPAEVKIHLLGYDDIPQDDVILAYWNCRIRLKTTPRDWYSNCRPLTRST